MFRCLGFKRRDVMISFMLESGMIGVTGGALAPLTGGHRCGSDRVEQPVDAGWFAVLFLSIDGIRYRSRSHCFRNDRSLRWSIAGMARCTIADS